MVEEHKKSLFIVEDTKEIRDLLALVFSTEGYSVESAIHGQDALDKLKAMPKLPGMIFLDLMMPVMDGEQFRSEQLKDSRLAAIPVYLMTADSDGNAKSQKMGLAGTLHKPLNIDSLLDVAKKYCI